MKVKMLKHINGKVNGVKMGPYILNQEYELEEEKAQLFIESAIAEKVIEDPIESESAKDEAVKDEAEVKRKK